MLNKVIFIFLLFFTNTVYGVQTKNQISMLYVAIFDRASEAEGNRYWRNLNLPLKDIATMMLATPAALDYFGDDLNNNQYFVEHIYKNTLNKSLEDDKEGISFWVALLDKGVSKGEMIVELVKATTNELVAGDAQDQFNNRVAVSNYMADTLEKAPNDYALSTSFSGKLKVTKDKMSIDEAKGAIFALAYPVYEDFPIYDDYRDTFVYENNSQYKADIRYCIGYILHSCLLSTLPVIAQEKPNPTKAMIMSRLVVSHQWMGDRFSEMLDILDDDIKQLLGAVTAIVIDDDIIPSHYHPDTGAIYLDPRNLWLTPEEAKTITVKEDYRDGFGNGLKFNVYSRYIKNNEYVYFYDALDKNITRTRDDIKYRLASLLYHELAHANDVISPLSTADLDSNQSIYTITEQNIKNKHLLSDQLHQQSPLKSDVLLSLGGVLYHGEKATITEKNLDAEKVGDLFSTGLASDMYAYSTQNEDFAMLFEAVMMKYHYDIERDQGFVIKPTKKETTYKDYILGWGERNRIANPLVLGRARLVVESIFSSKTDWETFFTNDIGHSQLLEAGKNWWDSRELNSNNSQKARRRKVVPDFASIHFKLVDK